MSDTEINERYIGEWEEGEDWELCLQEALTLEELGEGGLQTGTGVNKRGDRTAEEVPAPKCPPPPHQCQCKGGPGGNENCCPQEPTPT